MEKRLHCFFTTIISAKAVLKEYPIDLIEFIKISGDGTFSIFLAIFQFLPYVKFFVLTFCARLWESLLLKRLYHLSDFFGIKSPSYYMQIEGFSVKPLFLKNLGRVFLRSGHRSISFFSKNRDRGGGQVPQKSIFSGTSLYLDNHHRTRFLSCPVVRNDTSLSRPPNLSRTFLQF